MNRQIRLLLIAATVGLVLVTSTGMVVVAVHEARKHVFAAFEHQARGMARFTAEAVADDVRSLDVAALRDRLRDVRTEPDLQNVYVADALGIILADGTGENARRDEKLATPFAEKLALADTWLSKREKGVFKLGGPIRMPDGRRIGFLFFEFSLDRISRAAAGATYWILAVALFFLAAAAAAGWGMIRKLALPLEGLARKARSLNLAPIPASLFGQKELDILAVTIDHIAAALHGREERVTGAVESQHDALVAADDEGRVQRVNEAALALLGYEREDLIDRPLDFLVLGESAGQDLAGELLREGSIIGIEKTYLAKDGRKIPVVFSGLVLRDEAGDVHEIVCLARENAEAEKGAARTKELEQALAEAAAARDETQAALARTERTLEQTEESRQRAQAELERHSNDQLWAWAEDELKRVKGLLERTQERLSESQQQMEETKRAKEQAEKRARDLQENLESTSSELERVTGLLKASAAGRTQAQEALYRANAQQRAKFSLAAPPAGDGAGRTGDPTKPRQAAGAQSASQSADHAPGKATMPLLEQHASPVVDWSEALAGVDGDLEFLRAIVTVFLDDCPRLLNELRTAVAQRNATELERSARMLKGAVGNFGAKTAVEAATQLETMARAGNLAGVDEAFGALEAEVERLGPILSVLHEEVAPPAPEEGKL